MAHHEHFKRLFGSVLPFKLGECRVGGAIALVTAAVSGAVTLAVALSPRLHFVFWQPMAHVALETAAALTALLAGFLVFARLWRDCRLNELLLTCALALLALLNLSF
jgi:hypothetical protein